MFIKDHLSEIETAIDDLKCSDAPIEDQIKLYNKTLRKIEAVHKKMQTLSGTIAPPVS